MAITVVQAASAQVANGATDTSVTVTLPSPTQSGNLLVVCYSDNGNTGTEPGSPPVSDNAGNTYLVAVPINNAVYTGATRFAQRFCANISGRSGHTVTYSTGSNTWFPSIAVAELAGALATAAAFDTAVTNDGRSVPPAGGLSPHAVGTIAAGASPDEIAVAGFTHGGGSNQVITSHNGWTIQTKQESTAKMPIALSTILVADFGVVSEAYDVSPDTTIQPWAGGIATYVAAPQATVTYGFASSG